MARTSEQLTPEEILSVEDLAALPANSVVYKDSSGNFSSVPLGASGTVLQSNGAEAAPTFETPAAWGSSLWTAVTGTRASNTSFTVSGDVTATFSRGLVVKWTESSVQRCGMVVSSSYSSPNTTVTVVGDTMASIDASSLKWTASRMEKARWAIAGTIGTTGSGQSNVFYADEPYRVLAANLQVWAAGTTNSTTVDLNKNGTTMFTTKPTLASGVASASSPFTADSGISLAIGDKVTLDVVAVQSTPAEDLYVQLYLFPTGILSLS